MQDVFYELIEEAKKGKVILDDEEWPYSFNTIIRKNKKNKVVYFNEINISTLIIDDEEEFFRVLKKYIRLELEKNRPTMKIYQEKNYFKQRVKFLIANLFANATTEDFNNPIPFIKRYTRFLKDNTFSIIDTPLKVKLGESMKETILEMQREKNSTMMETPNKITIKFKSKDGTEEYELPSIYYGIEKKDGIKTCYIYGIQNKTNKQSNSSYQKKINRMLYKINSGIEKQEIPEYFEYQDDGTISYPEGNITDVSVSFVLALNIFISLLQKYEIENLKAVPFLPLRYLSREIAANDSNNEKLYERNENIQTNLTNKFIRTFRRLAIQNKALKILAYPYESDEFLTMKVYSKNSTLDNIILEETNLTINQKIKK